MTPLLLALFAAGAAPQSAAAQADLDCYRLMAELARTEDPAARSLGLTAAGYFLGRIDAAAPGTDISRLPALAPAERPALLSRCTAALEAGGVDLRNSGEPGRRPSV